METAGEKAREGQMKEALNIFNRKKLMNNRKDQNRRSRRWGAISVLLILTMLLPALQPAAYAQSEGAATVDDLTRMVNYGVVESSKNDDGSVQFSWETHFEAGIVGFNIWAADSDPPVKLNDQMIAATGLGSPDARQYSFTGTTDATTFSIEHVTVNDQSAMSPAIAIGERVGESETGSVTDWEAIEGEHRALTEAQKAADAERVNRALDAVRGPAPDADEPLLEQSAGTLDDVSIFLPLITDQGNGQQQRTAAADLAPGARIEIHVNQDGIYRVTDTDLKDAGFNLTGITSAYLALSNKGQPVRMRVVAPPTSWGPVNAGEPYIEFVGKALDTLYTDTNVYILELDRTKAFRTFTNRLQPDMTKSVPAYYMETQKFEENPFFATGATGPDPWYWAALSTPAGSSVSGDQTLQGIDEVATSGGQAKITTEVFGYSYGGHHVKVKVNGAATSGSGETFSGAVPATITGQFNSNVLNNGNNTFTWMLPGDATTGTEVVGLESVEIEYPRHFVARSGALAFSGLSDRYEVKGLDTQNTVVYSEYRNRVWRMDGVVASSDGGGYKVTFPGWGADAVFHISEIADLKSADIQAGRSDVDITSGKYDYLIISHPNFISGLTALVNARTADGLKVKVIDVRDVYAQYSDSIFDAQAIRDYLTYAIPNMSNDNDGVDYILLVGGDTEDYRGYTSSNSISFIPSLFAQTYETIRHGAADPLYTDVDNDTIPDAALGRFPVRTTQELTTVINKTLAYSTHGKTAMFTADKNDGPSYTTYSNGFAGTLPAAWQIDTAFLDEMTVKAARNKIIDAFNAGVGLVNYLGHSGTDRWTFSNMLNISHLDQLTNSSKPTVVVQYGCWGAYYTHPSEDSISQELLLRDTGAAVVLGATGLTTVSSDVKIGNAISPLLVQQGGSIGSATHVAKQGIGAQPNLVDVNLGWITLGDPALVMNPN